PPKWHRFPGTRWSVPTVDGRPERQRPLACARASLHVPRGRRYSRGRGDWLARPLIAGADAGVSHDVQMVYCLTLESIFGTMDVCNGFPAAAFAAGRRGWGSASRGTSPRGCPGRTGRAVATAADTKGVGDVTLFIPKN